MRVCGSERESPKVNKGIGRRCRSDSFGELALVLDGVESTVGHHYESIVAERPLLPPVETHRMAGPARSGVRPLVRPKEDGSIPRNPSAIQDHDRVGKGVVEPLSDCRDCRTTDCWLLAVDRERSIRGEERCDGVRIVRAPCSGISTCEILELIVGHRCNIPHVANSNVQRRRAASLGGVRPTPRPRFVGIFAFAVDLDFSRMGVTAFGLVLSPRSIATRRDAAVVPGMHRGTPATPSVPPLDGSAARMEAARIPHPDSQSDRPQPAAMPAAKHPRAIHTRPLAGDPEVPT